MPNLRILLVSHAYVEAANLVKIKELAAIPGLTVGVLSPESWQTWHGERKVKSLAGESEESFQSFTLPTFFAGDSGLYLYSPRRFFRLLKVFNPDIIQLEEEPWTPAALETAWVVKRLKKKLIFFTWENIDLPLNWWRRRVESFVFRQAALAIAGNQGAVERLRRRGFTGRVETLPQFGVDTGRFFPYSDAQSKVGPRQTLGIGPRSLVIGYAGRLTPDKGLETLLRAFARLHGRSGQETTMLLISSAKQLPEFLQDLRESLGVRTRLITVLGVSHEKFPEYLRLFDLQVLPSLTTPGWKEQFGRVLIEGMACGVPVLGSSSGAIPEVVGEGGLIFREGDVNDLAEKMARLINDQTLRTTLSKAGQARVNQLYLYPIIARETYRIYQSL